MNVTKLSELTATDIAEYLRLPEVTPDDTNSLTTTCTTTARYMSISQTLISPSSQRSTRIG